jgi:hypothetical protein
MSALLAVSPAYKSDWTALVAQRKADKSAERARVAAEEAEIARERAREALLTKAATATAKPAAITTIAGSHRPAGAEGEWAGQCAQRAAQLREPPPTVPAGAEVRCALGREPNLRPWWWEG